MKRRRVIMSLLGVLVCAAGVGAFKTAAMGVDPFTVFMSGMNQLIPISYGTLYVIVNVFLLIFSLAADRLNIGIATFMNLLFFGYMTEFIQNILQNIVHESAIPARLICLLAGVVIQSLGSSLYMTAGLGVSTYDAIANTLAYKWKIAQFRTCRIGCDLITVIVGIIIFLIGGGTVAGIPTIAGIGTLVSAFGLGQLISFFNKIISVPLLKNKMVWRL